MLVNLTRCMRYWDDLSVTKLLAKHMGISGKADQQSSLISFAILSLNTVRNVSAFRSVYLFQEQLGV